MTYGDYPELSAVKRLLVVKLRHLGDVLLTTPLFSVLHTHLPGAQIDACLYSECAPLLGGHPAIGELLCVDRSWKKLNPLARFQAEISFLKRVRKNRYDLVIQLTEGDRGALIARTSGAPIRVGWAQSRRENWFTHLAKNSSTPRHRVERDLDALRRIGIFPEPSERELFFPEVEAPHLKMFAGAVVIHPASRWRFKCWPVGRMRDLTRQLLERGERVIFVSGPDLVEKEMVEEIVAGFDVINLSGQLSLPELGALLRISRLLICVDSMVLHLASALKIAVITLFGPTSEENWGPWRNPRARVVTAPFSCRPCYQDGCGGSKRSDCLAAISPERVLGIMDELLMAEYTPSV